MKCDDNAIADAHLHHNQGNDSIGEIALISPNVDYGHIAKSFSIEIDIDIVL
jgi:hypothetical protein